MTLSGFLFWCLFSVWLFLLVQKSQTICCKCSMRLGKSWAVTVVVLLGFLSVVWPSLLNLRLEKLSSGLSPHLQCSSSASIFLLCCPCRVGSHWSWCGIPLAGGHTSYRNSKSFGFYCCSLSFKNFLFIRFLTSL
jgi:hypothetical protein